MAMKVDPAVAKARQQKMILIVGAVVLAGLLVLQGPKLMKQLNGSKSASTASSTTTTPSTSSSDTSTDNSAAAPAPTTSAGTAVPAIAIGATSGPTAKVAGVSLRVGAPPTPQTGQLVSFSSFKAKDPFVPGVKDGSGAGAGSSGGTTTASGADDDSGSPAGAVTTPSTATPVAFAYATLMVNGKPQQLALKQVFPKGQPTFVLQRVDKNSIKIAVAGGKFSGGGAITLERGKAVTLMNTTTGQRFVMKLVFTGDQPEQIAGFKQPAPAAGQTTTATQTTTASTP